MVRASRSTVRWADEPRRVGENEVEIRRGGGSDISFLLILTDSYDTHIDFLVPKLREAGISFFRLNLDVASLLSTYITRVNEEWEIEQQSKRALTSEFSVVYARRAFVEQTLEEQSVRDTGFSIWRGEWNKTLLGIYESLRHAHWLNPLGKAYRGENKYFQMHLAHEVGFQIPETMVSNRKKDLQDFANRFSSVSYKAYAQGVYAVGEEYLGLYANRITNRELANFGGVEENPIVLQEYVEKAYEVRYTVVGKEHYACRIESQQSEKARDDWRHYDLANTPHYPMEAPNEIQMKVNVFMEKIGLEYGAFDFIVDPRGTWYFLEINCMGQWLWIEQLTGLPISDAIIRWIKSRY